MKITKKNGERVVSLTKTEVNYLRKAAELLDDIALTEESAGALRDGVAAFADKYEKKES